MDLLEEVKKKLAEIDQLLLDFRNGIPLDRPPELKELAERALASSREGIKDVDAWAKRLADDVADATD